MPFRGGDVFLDLGVGCLVDGQYVALDGRCSVVHLTIDAMPWFEGLSDVGAEFAEVHRGRVTAQR